MNEPAGGPAPQLEDALLFECAEWVTQMLAEEEGAVLDTALILNILLREAGLREQSAGPLAHSQMAERLSEALDADGVFGSPDAISPPLLMLVLTWEDEFLALAGRPRAL